MKKVFQRSNKILKTENRSTTPGQKTLLSFFASDASAKTSSTSDKASKTFERNNDMVTENLQHPTPKKIKLNDDTSSKEPDHISEEERASFFHKKLQMESQNLKLLDPEIGTTWFAALENEFKKNYFIELNNFVTSKRTQKTVYPPPENVWEWTKQTSIRQIKVVILGQDPYHGPRQAHGLCFSVRKGVPPPPSLVNIFKELAVDIPGFKTPTHGDLSGWSKQGTIYKYFTAKRKGVLLLNAVLTVDAGNANSHKDMGWEKVTDAVIAWISKNLNGVVFLLWGSYAQKKAIIVDKKRHHLLQSVHPSPLSAHRGFLGCKHFSKCNDLLAKDNKKPIDWSNLP